MNFARNQTLSFAVVLLACMVAWSLGDETFLGTGSPEALASLIFGERAGRFLRNCPPALITYLVAALFLRHVSLRGSDLS